MVIYYHKIIENNFLKYEIFRNSVNWNTISIIMFEHQFNLLELASKYDKYCLLNKNKIVKLLGRIPYFIKFEDLIKGEISFVEY